MRMCKFISPCWNLSSHARGQVGPRPYGAWRWAASKRQKWAFAWSSGSGAQRCCPGCRKSGSAGCGAEPFLPWAGGSVSGSESRTFPEWKFDGWVTIFVSPHMVSQWYLAVEPPCVLCVWVSFVCKPSSTVGPSIWMCAGIASPPPVRSRIIRARLDLRMVKQIKQQLSKGANELAGSPRWGSSCLPCPEGLKKRATELPGRGCPVQAA